MTWGKDLWDQFDQIASHTSKGIDFCDKFAQFTKERAVIENEYAAKLKKLVKNYQPKKKEEDVEWSTVKAFNSLIAEVFDMAGQHEMVADNLNNNVHKELLILVQQVKQERKKHLSSGHKQNVSLQNQIQLLEKSKNKYEKAYKEMEKATEAYKKADADKHMSRADVEKAQQHMQQRQQVCEDCRKDTVNELNNTNQHQQQHYKQHMPAIFDSLEEMEQRRTERVQEMIRGCADVEKNILPIINSCISGIDRAADTISFTEDVQMVIDKYKSGFQLPDDFVFEELSRTGQQDLPSPPLSTNKLHRTELGSRNSFSVGSMKSKRKTRLLNLFSSSKLLHILNDENKEDFSHLPPSQQRKKLHQKLEGLRGHLAKETAERDGMLKMQDVYKQNNALGDPASIGKQLEENGTKLDQLRLELQKYENYMSEVDSGSGSKVKQVNSSSPLTCINDKINYRSSMLHTDNNNKPRDNNNISLSGSFNNNNNDSLKNNNSFTTTTTNNNNNFSMATTTTINKNNFLNNNFLNNNDDDDKADDNRDLIGPTCYALFPFTAVSEGSISMAEGEEFEVLETDQGDGWVQVRRLSNHEEGFVPSSYVRMHADKEFDDYDDDSVTS